MGDQEEKDYDPDELRSSNAHKIVLIRIEE
jgi:hypothetical protein